MTVMMIRSHDDNSLPVDCL